MNTVGSAGVWFQPQRPSYACRPRKQPRATRQQMGVALCQRNVIYNNQAPGQIRFWLLVYWQLEYISEAKHTESSDSIDLTLYIYVI